MGLARRGWYMVNMCSRHYNWACYKWNSCGVDLVDRSPVFGLPNSKNMENPQNKEDIRIWRSKLSAPLRRLTNIVRFISIKIWSIDSPHGIDVTKFRILHIHCSGLYIRLCNLDSTQALICNCSAYGEYRNMVTTCVRHYQLCGMDVVVFTCFRQYASALGYGEPWPYSTPKLTIRCSPYGICLWRSSDSFKSYMV